MGLDSILVVGHQQSPSGNKIGVLASTPELKWETFNRLLGKCIKITTLILHVCGAHKALTSENVGIIRKELLALAI